MIELGKNTRKIAASSVILLLIIVVGISMRYPLKGDAPKLLAPSPADTLSGTKLEQGQAIVDESFSTHLPIVVFDTGSQEPRMDSYWDDAKGYQVKVDYDPYADGQVWLIDNKDGLNTITDTPTMVSPTRIKLRGNSSANFPKKQYLLKLYDENGNKNEQNLLGMGKDYEWILNISWHDPSLLRNFLSYRVGAESRVLSPQVEYCEVVQRRGDTYEYLGVYLLMESVGQSKARIDIPSYRQNQTLSYILRRDRYDESSTMLSTFATENKLLESFLEVKYPNADKLAPNDEKRINDEIDRFERVLFAEDTEDFLTYPNHIDVDTFVDYFVINELLMNYDAGFNSTYVHKGYNGKITMGPFWDFDQAMANDREFESNLESTAFHNAPWFRQLLNDPAFVQKVCDRYHELRKETLSDDAIRSFVKDTVAFLGTAAERDWSRWEYGKQQISRVGQSGLMSFDSEVEYMQNVILTHGAWLDENIESLFQFRNTDIEMISNEDIAREKADKLGDIMAVVYVGVFLISVILIRQEG